MAECGDLSETFKWLIWLAAAMATTASLDKSATSQPVFSLIGKVNPRAPVAYINSTMA